MKELKRVKAIAEHGDPTSEEIGNKYKEVRRILWERQHYKCCFCEFKEQHDYNDVEHYRPKAKVQHAPDGPILSGYWWLAWSWDNLMFACQSCNRSYKRTSFPLDESSVPLKRLQKPPGRERPLLINPFEENPIDHIQFKPVLFQGRQRWIPSPRNGSEKGKWTIEIAGLDRDTLLDLYEHHYLMVVKHPTEDIEEVISQGDIRATSETWRRATKRLLNHLQPFAGLSYDMLDHFFPETVRASHGLELNRPS